MMPLLRLLRLPNLFTAFADVMLGYLFVHESLQPVPQFVSLLLASGLLYSAGMVLNDVFDVEQDARERSQRPIPSGAIALPAARRLGFGMLVGGVAAACVAGWLAGSARSGFVALILAIMILAYDILLKNTFAGPPAMGSCRLLNILLGMSTGAIVADGLGGFTWAQLCVALGIGVYVTGVTWFARQEANRSPRSGLTLGIAWMLAGFMLLAALPRVGEFADGTRQLQLRPLAWQLLVVWQALIILRRCLVAVVNPNPDQVQAAVKLCILSLIVIDATVCLAVRAPWWWAASILLLLIPTLTLGRWVYST
jgi:4-hydroxybenzoate polyprenyltransferase